MYYFVALRYVIVHVYFMNKSSWNIYEFLYSLPFNIWSNICKATNRNQKGRKHK